MIRGVKDAKAREDPKMTFLCLSNSNQVYIDTILKVRCAHRCLLVTIMTDT